VLSRRFFKHIIDTLDPDKFYEKKQKCFYLGNLANFQPHVSLLKQSQSIVVVVPFLLYEFTNKSGGWNQIPYPPGTKGFLYYSTSPEKPRIAGELRLRVTSSDDPASFESGSDLLQNDGRPWSRPLYILSKQFSPLYAKLKEDQLVPNDLDAVLSTLPSKDISHRRSPILYTLNDTFIVKFDVRSSTLYVITEQGVESPSFNRFFSEGRGKDKDGYVTPYTGAYKKSPFILIILMNL
jgi:hypothetical protein